MNTNLPSSPTKTINLIADIGGTNIRLAQATTSSEAEHADIDTTGIDISDIETYQCKDFTSLAEVVAHYLEAKKLDKFTINACFAIACPVDKDLISMTNLPWQFSQKDLKQALKLNSLSFINDYTAIAMAIPLLSDNQKVKIGGGVCVAGKPISVCGPGTGLGVANLVPLTVSGKSQWHCISGEGGHIDFAAINDTEQQVRSFIQGIKKRVSYEQLLSGYGLEQVYQALLFIDEGKEIITVNDKLSAKDITTKALTGTCATCEKTLTLFCNVLGSFAGNLALIMNSQGGVYIAGGIVPRFIDYLKNSDFRARFETKGRLSSITEQAPTYVITEQQPGLLGAAAFVLQKQNN
ncbi:glucokinase [Colwellia psychrerythraea]|uniref:Glucokinase n=1 Tax=Colwellia psychrerythraea TaxID=28229 RepID=A0A099KUH6_COLPS|nr:glucokinase [Colwellia psychrerythraea]KGJ93313.1 glucokinase [Colwellia psychrerythraea]